MKHIALIALAALATEATAQGLDFKGRMKPGEYEYTTAMEMGKMPGMPDGMQGMKMPGMTFKHCITQKDIDEGNQKALGQRPDKKSDCQMKDMKQTANGASYKMVCSGEMQMEMDTAMTWTATGFKAQTKMTGKQGGQPMSMNQSMEVKYLGPCKG